MAELITQAEFARRMNVNRKEVTKWKNNGRLVMVGKRVNYEESKRLHEATADPAFARKAKGSSPTYAEAKTKKVVGEAILKTLDVKERQRELVKASEVLEELSKANNMIKNKLRSIPSFIHLDISQIYGVTDAKKQRAVSAIVRKYIDEALEELSVWKP